MKTSLSIFWSLLWRALVWFPVMAALMIISSASLLYAVLIPLVMVTWWILGCPTSELFSSLQGTVVVVWLACVATGWSLRRFSIFNVHLGYNRL